VEVINRLLEVPEVKVVLPQIVVGEKKSGHTHPLEMACTTIGSPDLSYYIVKLYGDQDLRCHTCARELIGTLLGFTFGLTVANPAFVSITQNFAENQPTPIIRGRLANSIGLSYGSKVVEMEALQSLFFQKDKIQAAENIFAFDALIQNPDRCNNNGHNPNMFQTREGFILYDHEMAFSFSTPSGPALLGGDHEPWDTNHPGFRNMLRNHWFFPHLRGEEVYFDEFTEKLAELSEEKLDTIISRVPEEWRSREIYIIKDHLLKASRNAGRMKRGLQEAIQ
jgi:hypothetical protein